MMGWRNYYLDTEFVQHKVPYEDTVYKPTDLISIGIVDEDGREFYAVSCEFNRQAALEGEFIESVVLPRLDRPEHKWQAREDIRQDILDYLGEDKARFYYWYLPQDWVNFSDLMADHCLDLPDNIFPFGINLAQTWLELGKPDILPPVDKEAEHNALVDAVWLKRVHEALQDYGRSLQGDKPKPAP